MYIRFDEFCLNTLQLELTIAHHCVSLDERICLLLRLLVENYPSYCTKQTCLEHIWPDTIVSGMSLSKLVSDTRKVFKQAGCEVAIIQTVHGRGYRLSQELGKQLTHSEKGVLLNPIELEPNDAQPNILSLSTDSALANDTKIEQERVLVVNDTDPESLLGKLKYLQTAISSAAREWPKVTTILCSVFACCVLLYTLLSVHSISHVFTSGHSKVSEKEIVYSEPVDAIGRVIWVDDHPENNTSEREFLREQHLGVYSTTSTKEALLLMSLYHYDVVISDMGREEDAIAGLKLLERMRSEGIKTPLYIYTLNATEELVSTVERSGGQGVAVESDALLKRVMSHF